MIAFTTILIKLTGGTVGTYKIQKQSGKKIAEKIFNYKSLITNNIQMHNYYNLHINLYYYFIHNMSVGTT